MIVDYEAIGRDDGRRTLCDSKVGEGSTFSILVPRTVPEDFRLTLEAISLRKVLRQRERVRLY